MGNFSKHDCSASQSQILKFLEVPYDILRLINLPLFASKRIGQVFVVAHVTRFFWLVSAAGASSWNATRKANALLRLEEVVLVPDLLDAAELLAVVTPVCPLADISRQRTIREVDERRIALERQRPQIPR